MLSSLIVILLSLFLSTHNSVRADFNESVFNEQVFFTKELIGDFNFEADKGFSGDVNSRAIFFAKKADDVQPIASITKLMTALVFLDNNPGWEKYYEITSEDYIEGGRLHLFTGDRVKIEDIFATSLIASDNGATLALVSASGLSREEFVRLMNEKARQIGLKKTIFFDVTGLSDENVSTAREVAIMAREAFLKPEISKITSLKDYSFVTLNGREKKIESTNYLLFSDNNQGLNILGAKTGYTDKAGYCFVGKFSDQNNREIISVILNSGGRNDRFLESRRLANWVFSNYQWPKSF